MNHSSLSNPTVTALERLLELHDEAFIAGAYEMILRRTPDPDGFANYLAQVRAGVHKAQIIMELAGSSEGRLKCPDLPRIRRTLTDYRNRGLSFWNRQLRKLANTSKEPSERQLRVIDNRLYLLEQTLAQQKKQLAEVLTLVKQIAILTASPASASVASDDSEATHAPHLPHLSPNLAHTVAELKAAIALKRGK